VISDATSLLPTVLIIGCSASIGAINADGFAHRRQHHMRFHLAVVRTDATAIASGSSRLRGDRNLMRRIASRATKRNGLTRVLGGQGGFKFEPSDLNLITVTPLNLRSITYAVMVAERNPQILR